MPICKRTKRIENNEGTDENTVPHGVPNRTLTCSLCLLSSTNLLMAGYLTAVPKDWLRMCETQTPRLIVHSCNSDGLPPSAGILCSQVTHEFTRFDISSIRSAVLSFVVQEAVLCWAVLPEGQKMVVAATAAVLKAPCGLTSPSRVRLVLCLHSRPLDSLHRSITSMTAVL